MKMYFKHFNKPFSMIKNGLILAFLIFISGCQPQKAHYEMNEGQAHGTFYHIIYESKNEKNHHEELRANMHRIDKSLSTYDNISVISRINQNDESVVLDDHFLTVFKRAQEIAKHTHGAFDITVAPLVNAWGFGFTEPQKTDSTSIATILENIGYEKLALDNNKIVKASPLMQLDANAIAKGYSVDQTALLLEKKGIENYMVEIGGEVRVKGINPDGKPWRIGIDEPTENNPINNRKLQRIIQITNGALATSGNYRQFYEKNNQRYSHTINPKTGFPVRHSLLSASVIAPDCMTADAYATAFMVLGYYASIDIVENMAELEAYFILSSDTDSTYVIKYSQGMKKYFVDSES